MGIYSKCRKAYDLVKNKGLRETAGYYFNRKKEQERILHLVQRYHISDEQELERQRKEIQESMPVISIVTPLFNTPEEYLRPMLESVLGQTYTEWELCLADGSDGTHTSVGDICREYAKEDSRILYKRLEQNEGIVGNTNRCMELASGNYIGLLDHDDILHPSALYEAVRKIRRGADFIYTDEMKFSESIETSVDIVCKNGFGKDELRSHNYICHFVVFRKSLLEDMEEWYRKDCEGSQDYDMVLRLTEKAHKIVHIPRILYYWRVHQGSVSMDLSVKQYAVEAAKTAIASQLERSGEPGKVECNYPYETIYRIEYQIMGNPLISIFLWGDLKKEAITDYVKEIISMTHYKNLEIIVSGENRVSQIEGIPVMTVPMGQNNMYEWLNQADICANGDYSLFLNGGCVPVNPMWVEEMLMFVQRKDVGVVGPQILYGNNRTCFAGAVLDKEEESGVHVIGAGAEEAEQGYEANLKHVRNTSILTSYCMMISREQFHWMEGFQPEMGSCADADLCLRCRGHGLWNVWTCFAQVFYHGSDCFDAHWDREASFWRNWSEKMEEGDEYYHPLLKELGKV